MKLRAWQAACVSQARAHFQQGADRFLCLASPGAGKTVMASELANQLFRSNHIDLVVCFSPSVLIARNFQATLATVTGKKMDGGLASRGRSLTYQQLLTLNEDFWQLFDDYRVFVIFDEIHHCGGSDTLNATAWGSHILKHIRDRAQCILSLSGTPWRTDNIPVVLGHYDDNGIVCDYVYGLADAITDQVCREPHLIAVDNTRYQLIEGQDTTSFASLTELLADPRVNYLSVLNHKAVMTQILTRARRQLHTLQRKDPTAAGLVVASSIEHAHFLKTIFQHAFGEAPAVVSHKDKRATERIEAFRHSDDDWILSVGMISEGTDIPRLQVCCHLSFVKTELYFRQILGRVLRVTPNNGERGYLYFPAEPTLMQFARRLVEDIPAGQSSLRLCQEASSVSVITEQETVQEMGSGASPVFAEALIDLPNSKKETAIAIPNHPQPAPQVASQQVRLEVFGRFQQEVIRLHTQ